MKKTDARGCVQIKRDRMGLVKVLCELTVAANAPLGGGLYLLTLQVPPQHKTILSDFRAGMFAMLHCDEDEPFRFPRPFSFVSVDAEAGKFGVYFKAVGERTRWLANRNPGARLTGLLPLGNAFTTPPSNAPVILIAGGVGVAPLLMMASELAAAGSALPDLFFGARTSTELTAEYVSRFPVKTHLATDDGTRGFHGTVVELAASERIAKDARVFACGPSAMLRALSEMLPREIPVEVSLEEIMACGIGACYGCAVHTDGIGASSMSLVCRDGPVFNLRKVRFSE